MTTSNFGNQQMWFSTKQVATRFGVSVGTIWRWIAAGKFPKPVMITQRACRWPEAALAEFEQRTLDRQNQANQSRRRVG